MRAARRTALATSHPRPLTPLRALADATTIHAINSCVLKASKLMKACRVYRGSTRGALPASFFEKDEFGLSGGVELGFSSTTVERAQAEHYAHRDQLLAAMSFDDFLMSMHIA